MRKNKSIITCLSAVALFGSSLVSLTGCGNKNVKAPAEHFSIYLSKETSNGEVRLSSGGEGLVSDEEKNAVVNVYDAPKGFDVSFEVRDSDGKLTDAVSVGEDGKLKVSDVKEATVYTVRAIASKGEGENLKSYSVDLDLTVAPDNLIAKNETIDFSEYSTSHLEEIAGSIETYLLNHGMEGISFFNNGGYRKVSSRVKSGLTEDGSFTDNSYVAGYGFGVSQYGWIAEDNPQETNSAWKRFYHTEVSKLSDDVNYLLASDSSTSSYFSSFNASYYAQTLSATNAVVYQGALAKDNAPFPVDADGKELAADAEGAFDTWKVYLNDDVTYRYGGKAGTVASKYEGQKATLKDYITIYALQLTQWVGCQNVSQLLSGTNSLKGAGDWYKATAEKPADGKIDIDEFLKTVGIEMNEEENSLTFHFNGKFTTAFGAYYVNNYGPMPLSFFEELGNGDVKEGLTVYGRANATSGTATQDNVICTGPWVLSEYDVDKRCVLTKNDKWHVTKDTAGRDLYKLEGSIETVNTALKTDTTYATQYEQYKSGYIDVSAIPTAVVSDVRNEPDTVHITDGGSNYFMSVDTLQQQDYEYLFGEDGVACCYGDVTPGSGATAEEDQYDHPDMLANRAFVKGLNTAFDRETTAESLGVGSGCTTFWSSVNKMTPASTDPWIKSDAYQGAVKAAFGQNGISTNSTAQGVSYFRQAIQEELDAGHIALGKSAENPFVINIAADHQSQYWATLYKVYYDQMEDTFASAVKANSDWCDENGEPLLKLEITENYEADYINIYVNTLSGKAQISQASISGSDWDVYGLFELFESRNYVSNLTCWQGVITEVPSAQLFVDGKYYSLDCLAFAKDGEVKIGENGEFTNRYTDFGAGE